jgi:citrate synthase
MMDLTAEELRRVLHYDPDTGIFTWKVTLSNRNPAGKKAGCIDHYGYIMMSIHGKRYKAHRLAWLYMTGAWPTNQIDHKFNNRSDNRFSELREADYFLA